MIVIMPDSIAELLATMAARERSLGTDSHLFYQDDPVTVLFLVTAGEIRLLRRAKDGSAVVLQRAGPSSVLAEASLYSARYHCDAVATQPTRVRAIPRRDFRQRFRKDPHFAATWAAHLAHAVQNARFRSELVSLKTVESRLDAWLAWHRGAPPRKGAWRQVADEIAVSPEALYRELARRRRAPRP